MKSKENSRVIGVQFRSWSLLPEVLTLPRQAGVQRRSSPLPFDDAKVVKIFRLRKDFEKFFCKEMQRNMLE
jgi:hypothetical protein